MQLLAAWKDSLKMLKWQNLKLLLLVTLNSFVQGWRVLFNTYLLKMLVVIFVTFVVSAGVTGVLFMHPQFFIANLSVLRLFRYIFISLSMFSCVMFFIGMVCMPFAWFLAIRPSVEQKTSNYFLKYFKKFWYVIPLFFFICGFPTFVAVFFILFLLDSDGSIKSFFKSIVRFLKMAFYNLPLLLIVGVLSLPFYFLFILLSGILFIPLIVIGSPLFIVMGGAIVWALYFFIFYPLQICFFANIYIKKLHDQFGLYFDQPQ